MNLQIKKFTHTNSKLLRLTQAILKKIYCTKNNLQDSAKKNIQVSAKKKHSNCDTIFIYQT